MSAHTRITVPVAAVVIGAGVLVAAGIAAIST